MTPTSPAPRWLLRLLDRLADAAPEHKWSCGACPARMTSHDELTVQRYAAAHLDRTGHYYTNGPAERARTET